MNFFESQERARKYTTLLVVLFVVAVLALIVMTYMVTLLAHAVGNDWNVVGLLN